MINSNFYNFNKTGFQISIIVLKIIIIYTDRYSKVKIIQSGNREQIIIIICINSKSKDIPLFLII